MTAKEFFANLLGRLAILAGPRLVGDKSAPPLTKGTAAATGLGLAVEELTKANEKKDLPEE